MNFDRQFQHDVLPHKQNKIDTIVINISWASPFDGIKAES
jgi:hypothetical protein